MKNTFTDLIDLIRDDLPTAIGGTVMTCLAPGCGRQVHTSEAVNIDDPDFAICKCGHEMEIR